MKKFIAVIVLVTSLLTLSSCSNLLTYFGNSPAPKFPPSPFDTTAIQELTWDKSEYTNDETITVNYSVSYNQSDEAINEFAGCEIVSSKAVLSISAYGFLITCGDKSARSYLEVEISDIHTAIPVEDETSNIKAIYEIYFNGSFTLSDYKSEDFLGFISFNTLPTYTCQRNKPQYRGTYDLQYYNEPIYCSVTENENKFTVAKLDGGIDSEKNESQLPPTIFYVTYTSEQEFESTISSTGDYVWRGREGSRKSTIIQIASFLPDSTMTFKLRYFTNDYVHPLYDIKIFSYDPNHEDEREEQFSYNREEKTVTLTPELYRIYTFEFELEHGHAKYEVKFIPYDPSN